MPKSVLKIESHAFWYCTSLQNIDIRNDETIIEKDAFDETLWYNNQSDGIIYLGNCLYKYKGNMSLQDNNVCIKNGTVTISNEAFKNCSLLQSIDMPDSIKIIGEEAFYDCTSLKKIKMSNNIIEIGSNAFLGTSWYKNQSNDAVYVGKCLYRFIGSMSPNTNNCIKKGTISISGRAFFCNKTLETIDIPNSVKKIGGNAFAGCSYLQYIDIPNSVTAIEWRAFYNCI